VIRSRRRTTVVSGMIAAGVLSGGVGMVATAPAAADPAGSGSAHATDGSTTGERGDGNIRRQRRPAETAPATSPDRGSAGRVPIPAGSAEVPHVRWPCPWPWPWPIIRPVVPPEPGSGRGNSGFIAIPPAAAAPQVPVPMPIPTVSVGVEPELPDGDLVPAESPVAAPLGVAVPPRPPAPAPFVPGLRAAAPPSARSAPVPATPFSATVLPARVAPDPLPRPGPVSEPPESVRLGYPAELRDADFAKVAALALPGLAAIIGMTAFGGVVGYRQAKAGYLVRAAGAGRFLQ